MDQIFLRMITVILNFILHLHLLLKPYLLYKLFILFTKSSLGWSQWFRMVSSLPTSLWRHGQAKVSKKDLETFTVYKKKYLLYWSSDIWVEKKESTIQVYTFALQMVYTKEYWMI
jgi:hypothetical protein